MSQAGSFMQGGGPFPPSVLETLTGDVGGAVPATLNNIDVLGGDNINTVGTPGTSTIEVFLNETIRWPETNGAGTTGAIYLGAAGGVGGTIFMHNYTSSVNGECTFLGLNAGGDLTGTGVDNTGIGYAALKSLAGLPDFASGNTGLGSGSLTNLITGGSNTGCGNDTLASLQGGFNNFAAGDSALLNLTTGNITTSSYNTAVGALAGLNLQTGSYNTLIGTGDGTTVFAAGENYVGVESSNICINNPGVATENNTIRIGVQGAGNGQINRAFVAGIFGSTVGVSGIPVVVDNAGQLGTIVSSKRFKKDIQPMREDDSSALMHLRPVSFRMNEDFGDSPKRFGLIAEEVEDQLPYLVCYDEENKPFSVKYNELPIFLLNELQKQHSIINSLVRRINLLESIAGNNYEL